MAYTRTYTTVVPVEPGTDMVTLRWLVRESFERKAADDLLTLADYTETELSVDDIPPKAAKQLPRPLSDYTWHKFTATATATSA